jgi:hypothetical protein
MLQLASHLRKEQDPDPEADQDPKSSGTENPDLYQDITIMQTA